MRIEKESRIEQWTRGSRIEQWDEGVTTRNLRSVKINGLVVS